MLETQGWRDSSSSSSPQVKIMKNPELLHTASEQFLGKKEHEIKSTVLQTLEGHLRAILGTLTVEAVCDTFREDSHSLCLCSGL